MESLHTLRNTCHNATPMTKVAEWKVGRGGPFISQLHFSHSHNPRLSASAPCHAGPLRGGRAQCGR